MHPFERTSQQSFGVRVSELELDVLPVAFDRFPAYPELLRDATGTETCVDQAEHVELTIGQARYGTGLYFGGVLARLLPVLRPAIEWDGMAATAAMVEISSTALALLLREPAAPTSSARARYPRR